MKIDRGMDFESPDVEKEFPGLYASESARKSNESDCMYCYYTWQITPDITSYVYYYLLF